MRLYSYNNSEVRISGWDVWGIRHFGSKSRWANGNSITTEEIKTRCQDSNSQGLLPQTEIPLTIEAPAASAPRGSVFFRTIEQVRRFSKILAGFTLLLVGVIMFFTPGPGWLVVFLGLTLLAAEFVWAKRLMDRMKHEGNRLKDTVLKFSKN